MITIDWKRPKVIDGATCADFDCSKAATHIFESPSGNIWYECFECASRKSKEYREKLKEDWRVIKPNKHESNGNVVLGYPVKKCGYCGADLERDCKC